jgi:serine/threonine protein phosphatase PrpC/cytochrome c-type biogenesis protein CcmH/NrfG
MSTASPASKIQVASVSDRGLNEKRPLNEDSFLADANRGIFVVADGVGGAEAGEVASAAAVDVIDKAFQAKLADGDDTEDVMELAIQRANSSIHQMATEHPRLSTMATTVVALHLDGHTATFGHVGDSRLYRLTPDGKLLRETEDHSIVEEEVRAGRMTPEQAANHPSKNVISRALGAEASVEADMKTTEVEEGSTFLLCTDGITRHIPDNELRELLLSAQPPDAICAEMKRRCYERGAEDNLTAIIVQVGQPKHDVSAIDDERTIDARVVAIPSAAPPPGSEVRLTPPSRIAFPGPAAQAMAASRSSSKANNSSRGGRGVLRFFVFLLFLAVAGGAFYGGMRYQRFRSAGNAALVTPPAPVDDRAAFEHRRALVDADTQKWLAANVQPGSKPLDSKDPEFLYFYGRAQMLQGNHSEARAAFRLALTNLQSESRAGLPLEAEIRLADAADALKSKPSTPSQAASMAEKNAVTTLDELLGLKSGPTPK